LKYICQGNTVELFDPEKAQSERYSDIIDRIKNIFNNEVINGQNGIQKGCMDRGWGEVQSEGVLLARLLKICIVIMTEGAPDHIQYINKDGKFVDNYTENECNDATIYIYHTKLGQNYNHYNLLIPNEDAADKAATKIQSIFRSHVAAADKAAADKAAADKAAAEKGKEPVKATTQNINFTLTKSDNANTQSDPIYIENPYDGRIGQYPIPGFTVTFGDDNAGKTKETRIKPPGDLIFVQINKGKTSVTSYLNIPWHKPP
jgi:hypothetical protein